MRVQFKFKESVMSSYWSFRYYVWRLYYRRKIPIVLNTEDTLRKIIDNRVSISRYGDGELHVMQGGSIGFCKGNEELSRRLQQVLTEPLPNLLVCIPIMIKTQKGITQKARKFWRYHFALEYPYWLKFIDGQKIYGNTNCSRFYIGVQNLQFADTVVALWRKVWNNKICVIVEGANTRMGMGNDLLRNAKNVQRILCPSTDAFIKYDTILATVKEIVKKNKGDCVVLMALGPTATVLAYDLCKYGIQAIDCGHLDIEYEWYLQKTPVRTDIPAKAVNECWGGGLNVVNDVTESYEREIVCRID